MFNWMQERMEEARALFRNKETTEFVIVTIPTAMAAAESGRLAKVRLPSAPCLLAVASCCVRALLW